ncbi:MAG: universal stress protein [Lautropia sp.]
MFKHLIVPIDLSHEDPARHALAVARQNLAPGGRLTLLHVVAPLPAFVVAEMGTTLPANVDERARGELAALAERHGLPAGTELRIEHGSAARAILDAVDDPDGQAIVMSSHNPKFGDFLIGSVAAQVVKHARCSVFVVRHRA